MDNCVIKGSYCKWEELPPCGWDDKENNGVGVAPWDAGPGITLTRCLTNPDSTDNDTNRYLPKYGDTLCYVLKVTRPIDVVVKLWGSTYEGIAMNAPVPDTVGLYEDSSSVKYCDLVLLGGEFDGFVSGQFQQTRTIHVDSAVNVKVLVMDYAAHGYIRAYQATNPNNSARHPQTIIKGYSDWTSNADPDSDGFTRWEEYRGFIQKYGDVYSHVRLDSTKPELFYHPDSLVLIDQDDLVSILEGEELLGATLYDYGQIDFDNEATNNVATITQAYLSGLDSLRRYFIDFNCHYLDTAGWKNNTLCTPPGLEALPWDENQDTILVGDISVIILELDISTPASTTTGITYQYLDLNGNSSNPYERCNNPVRFYPGGGGNGKIIIYGNSLTQHVDEIFLDPTNYYLFPASLDVRYEFLLKRTARTIAHEFGHALGINHHCSNTSGSLDCVMKYIDPYNDYPHTPSPNWTTFIDLHLLTTYMNDSYLDPYMCRATRALRPIDQNDWPANW